jgi:V/A-type H+-transporting ATPase subunit K
MKSRVKTEFRARVRKVTALTVLVLMVACSLTALLPSLLAAEPAAPAAPVVARPESANASWIAMSAAISVVGATAGAGYAVAKVGVAALGAASEKPEILGRAIVFVGMAEGLVVFGSIVAVILVLMKI